MEVVKVAATTLGLNYGVHYVAARAYDYICVPHSLSGLLQSFVTTASPVCSAALQIMQVTQGNYATVLTSTVATLVARGLSSSQ